MESFLSSKGEELYCIDVGRRVCNERRRDKNVGEEACKGVSNGCMWNRVWEGAKRGHGEEDCLQFSTDFEGWMNLSEQEMIGNVFWLNEVGRGICLSS